MPGRNYQAGYRFGFNGQEMDDDISGIGNSYSAEFWQYSPRLGRRWNIDPIIKGWESPYASFSNNPISFLDPTGADTLDSKILEISFQGLEQMGNELEALGKRIKQYDEAIKKMSDMADEHDGWSAAFIFNPLATIAMQITWEASDADELLEARINELNILADEYETKYRLYSICKKDLAYRLGKLDAVRNDDGSLSASLVGVAGAGVHKNSNKAKGNFALYEFKIDGELYKFGVADADRVRADGTPERIAQQERRIKVANPTLRVETYYTIYENVFKYEIKAVEDQEVFKYLRSNGYVPDGNESHAKKANAPRRGRFPKKF